VPDRVYIVLVMIVLTGLTLASIAGHGPWAGDELVAVSERHGLNDGDIPILAAWAMGAACCWRLWRGPDS